MARHDHADWALPPSPPFLGLERLPSSLVVVHVALFQAAKEDGFDELALVP